jgi:hypothetical protein
MGWQQAPELQEWLDDSRLNLLCGLGEQDDGSELAELQGRFLEVVFPAIDKLSDFAARATPRERARLYEPSA